MSEAKIGVPRRRSGAQLPFLTLLALGLLACASAPVAIAQQCPSLLWADEFDGTAVDATRWSFQTGDGCAEGICGWGNKEEQTYQAENATVSGGTLKITAKKERVRNKQYTSARLRTLNKGDFFTGHFEARLKLPVGQGLWPAFWMLPTDEVFGGWPQSGEIDIMENIGSEASTVHATMHYGDPFPDNRSSGNLFNLLGGQRFTDDFHTFAIEKEQDELRWFVDGILYFTRTPVDIAPDGWPFNERFHFLLNLAVGGNFPGSPDASTVFPQDLEVDYVRVWDGNLPHITGDRVAENQEAGVAYSVGNAFAGSSFTWTVPAGAVIASGQGTSSITVDWGDTDSSGFVVVDISSGCGNDQLRMEVEVEPLFVRDFSFENFDDPANVTQGLTTGTLVEVANPAPDAVNSSALSGEYTRNAGEQFDVLFYSTGSIGDASQYVSKQRKFFIDVFTSAPVGSVVLLQLEDSSSATSSNFPTGRHSRYQALTTTQNQWEHLELPFLDQPDPGTSDVGVDNMVLLFAPNTFTGDAYTWDNLDSWAVAGTIPTAVVVADVTTGTQNAGRGQKHGTATVTVLDDLGNPVEGATVDGTFSGTFNETASGTTGANGTVTLVTQATAGGGVTVNFCVDAVTASLPLDEANSTGLCAP